jgi:hypothetical protein
MRQAATGDGFSWESALSTFRRRFGARSRLARFDCQADRLLNMRCWIVSAAAAAICIALAACSSQSQLERCPSVSLLVDTSSLTALQENPPAQPSVLYTVQMVRAKGDCDIPKYSRQVTASVDIDFRATRAQADAAASYTVPYFVAITSEGTILAKQVFQVQFAFAPGQNTVDVSDSVNSLSLTVGRDKHATDYGILVGLQLTKAQLDYNRRVGRYAP